MRYYISFDRYYDNEEDHWKRSAWVDSVRAWLETHAGEEYKEWHWERGDLLAVGVFVRREEIVTLFKLSFEV
jgi:hypothetical protein